MIRGILYSSILVNLVLIFGKMTGFIREVLVANVYGTSAKADVAVLLLTLPDLLVTILVGGAISSALIPLFSQNTNSASKLAMQSSCLLFFFFSIISIFLILNIDTLFGILSPDLNDKKIEQYSIYMYVVIASLPLSVITGVFSAYQQSNERFFLSSLGTVVFNITVIFGLIYLFYSNSDDLLFLSYILLFAALIRLLFQFFSSGVKLSDLDLKNWIVDKSVIIRYFQALGAGFLVVLFPITTRSYISMHGEGYLAMFNYAMRLVELPLMFSVTILSIILLPKLSRSFVNDKIEHLQYIKFGFQLTLSLTICLCFVLFTSSSIFVKLIYGEGIGESDIAIISYIVSLGTIFSIFQALNSFLVVVSNSRGNTSLPIKIYSLGFILLNLILLIIGRSSSVLTLMCILGGINAFCFLLNIFFFKVEGFKFRMIFEDPLFVTVSILVPFLWFFFGNYILVSNFSILLKIILILFFILFWLLSLAFSHHDLRQLILRKLRIELSIYNK